MKWYVRLLVTSSLVLVACWLGASSAKAQFSYLPSLQNGPEALCRLGLNGTLRSYPVNPLRLGWFLDYTAISPARSGIEYFPVVRLEQTANGYQYSFKPNRSPATEAQLRAAVVAKPGHYWIIGNEPDREIYQDDIDPPIYARAYHDLYHIIKDADPTAKIVAGTIVQPTPLRLEYLNMILGSYFQAYKEAMPVDAWAFHNFILNEASCSFYEGKVPPVQLSQVCWGAGIPPGVNATDGLRIDVQDNDRFDLFKEQVVRFRQWMAAHGYRNKPAFLSEFGILMPQGLFSPDFTTDRVNAYMNETFDYLLNTTDPNIGYPGDNNRLVQRFAWYSIDDNANHNGFIFNPALPVENSRTAMGDNFANYASAQAVSVDFSVNHLALVGAPPLVSQDATTITLEALVGNSGNLAFSSTATVRFFNGDPAAGGVQIGDDQTVSLPGCGEKSAVRIDWVVTPPSNHTVYVQIKDSSIDVNQSNNQASLSVGFAKERLFIPETKRDLEIVP